MPKSIVAALQIGSLPGGKGETLAQILSYEEAIRQAGARLVVMPEALLGGYPKGEGFGTQLGYRLPEGREAFARYFANAIDVPGVETEALAGLSARTGASLVLGVIERVGSTLYCTALYFEPDAGLVARHRAADLGQGRWVDLARDRQPGRSGRRGGVLGKHDAAAAHRDVRQRRGSLVCADGG